MDDTILQKQNIQEIPVKLIPKPCSVHFLPLLGTIVLYGSIGVSVFFYVEYKINVWILVGSVIGGYVGYFVIGVYFNTTVVYLSKQKPIREFENIYNTMIKSKPYFHMWSLSYHYITNYVDDYQIDQNNNRRHFQRAQTHQQITNNIRQDIIPSQTLDTSQPISTPPPTINYIFCKYNLLYQFFSPQDQLFFTSKYQSFKTTNNIDTFQDISYKYILPDSVQKITYFRSDFIDQIYCYIWMLLGCSYFYWLFQEYRAVRYEINIVKRLKFKK